MKFSDDKPKILPDFFWPSYSDLMTTLFFIMTLLYVISVTHLVGSRAEADKAREEAVAAREEAEKLNKKLKVALEEYKLVEKANESVQKLRGTGYFNYNEKYKRFEMNRKITFDMNSWNISDSDGKYLEDVGKSIAKLIDDVKENAVKNGEAADKIKYLLIVEGMASKDKNWEPCETAEYKIGEECTQDLKNHIWWDNKQRKYISMCDYCSGLEWHNYELSYKRAKSLHDFWRKKDIKFDPRITEIQIAGSGLRGVGRERDKNKESENQRFLIQIIPKIAEEKQIIKNEKN